MYASATWTIRKRLVVAFASLTAITLLVGGVGFYAAEVGASAIDEIGMNRLPSIGALLTVSEAQTAVDSAENALLAKNLTPAMRSAQYKRFDDAKARYSAAWKVYEPLPQVQEEEKLWKEFVPAWDAWWKDHLKFVQLAKAYESASTDANYQAMSDQALIANGESFGKAEALLNKIVDINTTLGESESKAASTAAARIKIAVSVTMALATLLAIALGFVITTKLNGVLTARVGELRQGAEQVTAAAGQVSSAAQGLSQGATEQAASLEETSASMEEMAAMTRRNASSASEAARLMAQVFHQVESSNHDLGEMVDAMAAIQESSGKISKIIKTIDEIAFQTNILALNAAVEAARAGDAGMGFAVVADEVRNLAQRAASAAKDTAVLIEDASRSAQVGNDRVAKVRDSISSLTGDVTKVKTIAEEVNSASQQQAQGIDQVTQAISQMEKVTQTTAATAEESAAASEELNAQAEQSMGVVHEIETLVHGSTANRVVAMSARSRKASGPVAAGSRPKAKVVPIKSESAEVHQADGTFGSF